MTDEKLSALLRLKRYEQPPAGYFDELLHNVQRRQRAELLRQPLWKIGFERIRVFFSEHSMGHLTYAGSMATLLIAGVAAIRFMTSGEIADEAKTVAIAPTAQTIPDRSLQLEVSAPPAWQTRALPVAHPQPAAPQPRYIIDARPVMYEPSKNYDF